MKPAEQEVGQQHWPRSSHRTSHGSCVNRFQGPILFLHPLIIQGHFTWIFKAFLAIDFFVLLNAKQYNLQLIKCSGFCFMFYHIICPEECSVYRSERCAFSKWSVLGVTAEALGLGYNSILLSALDFLST